MLFAQVYSAHILLCVSFHLIGPDSLAALDTEQKKQSLNGKPFKNSLTVGDHGVADTTDGGYYHWLYVENNQQV